jgi:hypothetical protein
VGTKGILVTVASFIFPLTLIFSCVPALAHTLSTYLRQYEVGRGWKWFRLWPRWFSQCGGVKQAEAGSGRLFQLRCEKGGVRV